MEVMSVFAQVDASPVSTVHIRPGNKVAVCCDVDGGGGGDQITRMILGLLL